MPKHTFNLNQTTQVHIKQTDKQTDRQKKKYSNTQRAIAELNKNLHKLYIGKIFKL